jgi:hypothetical protein
VVEPMCSEGRAPVWVLRQTQKAPGLSNSKALLVLGTAAPFFDLWDTG